MYSHRQSHKRHKVGKKTSIKYSSKEKIPYICNPIEANAEIAQLVEHRGNSSVGRASASQAEGREFESRFPLIQVAASYGCGDFLFIMAMSLLIKVL